MIVGSESNACPSTASAPVRRSASDVSQGGYKFRPAKESPFVGFAEDGNLRHEVDDRIRFGLARISRALECRVDHFCSGDEPGTSESRDVVGQAAADAVPFRASEVGRHCVFIQHSHHYRDQLGLGRSGLACQASRSLVHEDRRELYGRPRAVGRPGRPHAFACSPVALT